MRTEGGCTLAVCKTLASQAYAMTVATVLLQKADEAAVAAIDNFFEQVYRYTVRKALDVSLAAAASACVEEHSGTVGLAQLFFKVRRIRMYKAELVSDAIASHKCPIAVVWQTIDCKLCRAL